MNSEFKKPDCYKNINNSQLIINIYNNKTQTEYINIENSQEKINIENSQEKINIENSQKKNIKLKDNIYSRYNLYKLYYDIKNLLHL